MTKTTKTTSAVHHITRLTSVAGNN